MRDLYHANYHHINSHPTLKIPFWFFFCLDSIISSIWKVCKIQTLPILNPDLAQEDNALPYEWDGDQGMVEACFFDGWKEK